VSVANPVIAFSRLAFPLDAAALTADVQFLLGDNMTSWVDHVNRRDYLGGWDVLPLRCLREHLDAHPILQGFSIEQGNDWVDLPVLSDCPALASVLAQLHCPIRSARLMRLKAGAEIKPHRDAGLGMEYGEARLHVPVQYSGAVDFLVGNTRIPMAEAELWYINTDLIHEVYNRAKSDRINLVIDCTVNEWLREKIETGNCTWQQQPMRSYVGGQGL